MNKQELKRLKKLSREQELERIKKNGIIRSNSWGGKPSSKKQRRNSKNSLKKIVDDKRYEDAKE